MEDITTPSELTRSTIKIANALLSEIKNINESAEAQKYVRMRVSILNEWRGGSRLPEIDKNEVYRILGESRTCFWGYKE